MQDKTQMSS